MPREPRSNILHVCADCAPVPLAHPERLDPHALIGRSVKRAFAVRGDHHVHEHMWCDVLAVLPDGRLRCRLDNDPLYDVGYVCGDLVYVRLDQIEALYPED